ncbi:hypothetical protein ACFXTH_003329 [Malus domestica]
MGKASSQLYPDPPLQRHPVASGVSAPPSEFLLHPLTMLFLTLAAAVSQIEGMLEGIVLTSPALRVKPTHPIVGAMAPIVSMVAPKFQFKGANKRGIPVSRDPAQLLAKYYDPWSKQV